MPRSEEEEPEQVEEEEEDEQVPERCGLICLMFRQLETQLQAVQDEIEDIRKETEMRENEVQEETGDDEEDGPEQKTTYHEEVMYFCENFL